MNDSNSCPGARELERFLVGDLSDEQGSQVEAHLAGCRRCVTLLGQLKVEDRLVRVVRHAQPEPPQPTVARLVKRLSGLMLPAPPAASTPSRATPDGGPPTAEIFSLLLGPALQRGDLGRLGPYRVLRIVGAGGMGVVFEGEDTQLQRRVALKVMKPAMTMDPDCRQRFLREARAAAAIEHPNVVSIYQVGEDRGVPYLAMHLLRGQTLAARLDRDGRLSIAEVLCIGLQVAAGLAAAHKSGLVHRDIKPGNIWLEAEEDRVKILDFGLARVGQEESLRTPAKLIGTPEYMPPEQCRGEGVDERGDLYSFGCVLFEMCTGHVPIEGRDTTDLLLALAVQKPRPAHELNPDVPLELSALIQQLLAKDPADRPASAKAVGDALAAIPNQPQTHPDEPVLWIDKSGPDTEKHVSRRQSGASRRKPLMTLGLAVGLALTGLLLAVGYPLATKAPNLTQPLAQGVTRPEPSPVVQPPEPTLPDRPKPFVLTRAKSGKSEEYLEFIEFRDRLQTGDIVEVHGNGPFLLDRGVFLNGLTLRAAPGYRPRFEPGVAFAKKSDLLRLWFQISSGPLQLEDCDFCCPYPDIILFGGARCAWNLRNCRFINAGSVLLDATRCSVRIQDCLIVTGPKNHVFTLGAGTELELTNNLIRTSALDPVFNLSPPGGQTIRMENNTLLLTGPLWSGASDKFKDQSQIQAEGNLIYAQTPWRQVTDLPLKDRLRWQGRHNLYVGPNATSIQTATNKVLVSGLANWAEYWNSTEAQSGELASLVMPWTWVDRLKSPEGYRALDRRLHDLRQLKAGKPGDLGPIWDRLGSGEAYERTQVAAGGKAVGQGRPQPPPEGPFILWREGQLLGAFRVLQAALDATQSGDTVEMRTDDTLHGGLIPLKVQDLVLRAAPGYRPIFDGLLEQGARGRLTVEGIHFTAGLPPNAAQVRLINCSCSGPTSRCNVVEAVNCLLPVRLRIQPSLVNRMVLRNSVIGGLSFYTTIAADYALDLDHCVVLRNDLEGFLAGSTGPGRLKVSAQATLFEAGNSGLGLDGELYGRVQGVVLTSWTGTGNVYCMGPGPWMMADPDPITNLAAWQRRWGSDATSREIEPLYLDPRQWHLPADGKGFGAVLERVARPAPSR